MDGAENARCDHALLYVLLASKSTRAIFYVCKNYLGALSEIHHNLCIESCEL